MSRPSKSESKRLEQLEGVAAMHHQIQTSVGLLAVRLRSIYRRSPEVSRFIKLADEELARLADSCDTAQELLTAVLDADQEDRSE